MKTPAPYLVAALISWSGTCTQLMANTITLGGLPAGHIDTISIQLDPLNGAVHGVPGGSTGWGFTVDWTSTAGDWVSFTGSSLGSVDQNETNPTLSAGYIDLIGFQGGPTDFALSPGSWVQVFNGTSKGVGVYLITNSPSVAVTDAQDTGQITFSFQVYDGDPFGGGMQIGNGSYEYYGSSTAFSVTVDSNVPEPASWVLFGGGLFAMLFARRLAPPPASSATGRRRP